MIHFKEQNNHSAFDIFFNTQSEKDLLPVSNSKITKCLIKQVHGFNCIHQTALNHHSSLEADAHLTQDENLALLIQTADCLPVMIIDLKNDIISAIHAGWRGVENNIILEAIKHMQKKGSQLQDLKVWIGPHLQMEEFEVDLDVFERLTRSLPKNSEFRYIKYLKLGMEKYLLSLSDIVGIKLREIGLNKNQIWISGISTKTDPRFASYRRDGKTGLRNLSGVLRTAK